MQGLVFFAIYIMEAIASDFSTHYLYNMGLFTSLIFFAPPIMKGNKAFQVNGNGGSKMVFDINTIKYIINAIKYIFLKEVEI